MRRSPHSLKFLDELIRPLHAAGMNDGDIAEQLNESRRNICTRRRAMGLPVNVKSYSWRVKPITGHDERIRELHALGRLDREIAKEIGCGHRAVSLRRNELGLTPQKSNQSDSLTPHDELIRQRLSEGWSDSEIAAELGVNRRAVGFRRLVLGIAASGNNERRRSKVREKTQQQCQRAGVKSLAEVRTQAFSRFATDLGWPSDLRPRCVQILELLYIREIETFEGIARAIGMNMSRRRQAWLYCNEKGGSYVAVLQRRGLVARSGRVLLPGTLPGKTGTRSGCGVCLYGLTPQARTIKEQWNERTRISTQHSEREHAASQQQSRPHQDATATSV